MPSPGIKTAKEASAKDSYECVLLIESQADDAAKLLDALGSATDKRLPVEWVTEFSSGIERLRNGGVAAVVLDLTLSDSHGLETFERIFQAAPRVPILILSDANNEEMARQAVRLGAQDYLLKNQADGYRLGRPCARCWIDTLRKHCL